MMHGIQASEFGGPEVLRYRELPVPEPGAGQVRVRLHAVGVNPADTYIRTGTYAFFKPELPYTPGFDGAGVVDEVGAGVEGVGPGDRVFLGALGRPGSGRARPCSSTAPAAASEFPPRSWRATPAPWSSAPPGPRPGPRWSATPAPATSWTTRPPGTWN